MKINDVCLAATRQRSEGPALLLTEYNVEREKSFFSRWIMNSIVIGEQVRIPSWVSDFDSFRRWARSDEYPDFGCFSHLQGDLWVDLTMEKLWHNKIKTQYAAVLTLFVQMNGLGHFLGDRMLLSNLAASLSTEPDGLFNSKKSLKR